MSIAVTGTITWRDLINEAATRLAEQLGAPRRQEARWLVERVSGYASAELWKLGDEPVSTRSVAVFDQLVARRCAGEPLQYVLGRWAFRSLELVVDRSVLIPRPETELVAGLAIDAARVAEAKHGERALAVDLGTGSGAIALSLAAEVPGLRVLAADVSEDALRVARANLAGIGGVAARRVRMHHGSWFDALPQEVRGAIDVLVSNPPYVGDDEREQMPREVLDWEPHLALFGGHDGTDALRQLITGSPAWLRPGGTLVLELAPRQTDWAAGLASDRGFVRAQIIDDLAGRPRALTATWEGE